MDEEFEEWITPKDPKYGVSPLKILDKQIRWFIWEKTYGGRYTRYLHTNGNWHYTTIVEESQGFFPTQHDAQGFLDHWLSQHVES